jgi:hypothetical protein
VCKIEFSLNANSKALENNRPQDDILVSCVIAQQYFSVHFLSLRLHFQAKKIRIAFQNVAVLFIFLFYKLRKTEMV